MTVDGFVGRWWLITLVDATNVVDAVEGAVTRGATPREVLLLLNISEFGLVTVRHLVPYYYFYYPRGPRHVEALY